MGVTSIENYPFTGLPNTRDLGGLPTADGRVIRPGVLLRSTTLDRCDNHDRQLLLDQWRVDTVIDLRTPAEQEREPYDRTLFPGVRFADCPVLQQAETGVSREQLNDAQEKLQGLVKIMRPRRLMRDMYSSMLISEGGRNAYSGFFDTLLRDETQVALWHCTMGKDRAGLATALLLHALDVPWTLIEADYLATNDYLAASPVDENLRSVQALRLPLVLKGSFRVLNGVTPEYLHLALTSVNAEYGSMDAYLEQALGLSAPHREALQEKYLE